jgi:hypothetical protein
MQDPFSGQPTCIRGPGIPSKSEQERVLDDYRRRLRAFDRLGETAAECGVRADSEHSLLLVEEDEVSLLELIGGKWADFGSAIRNFRTLLPIVELELFGFSSEERDPFEVEPGMLHRIGGGVEALAFAGDDGSVYKFFLFRPGGEVGATFDFAIDSTGCIQATAGTGSYRLLLKKLEIIHRFGMPTEVVGITLQGVLVVKQVVGKLLKSGSDMSTIDPARMIPFPSRFLRSGRDHPRLAFVDGEPWLLGDTHDRNVVREERDHLRIIDLVAAPLPMDLIRQFPVLADWIERARLDPKVELLKSSNDDEL